MNASRLATFPNPAENLYYQRGRDNAVVSAKLVFHRALVTELVQGTNGAKENNYAVAIAGGEVYW